MKEPQTRTARLEARLSPDVQSVLKRAADLQGRSLSDFVIAAAHDTAMRVIEQAEILRLSRSDQVRFAKALINPPAPSAALKRARKRHQKLVV